MSPSLFRTGKPLYRADLFNPESFTSVDAIENALYELEGVLTEHNAERVLQDILSHEDERIIVLVLSCTSDDIPIDTWIVSRFPAADLESSLSNKLLSILSSFFAVPPAHIHKDVAMLMGTYRRSIAAAPAVLQLLAKMAFPADDYPVDSAPVGKKVRSQKAGKQARKNKALFATIDPQAFHDLGIAVPEGRAEAEDATQAVMLMLRNYFEFFYTTIRSPESARAIKERWVWHEEVEEKVDIRDAGDDVDQIVSPVDIPSAYPAVQPLKSALYFDSPDGFGDWQIVISKNTESQLRDSRKREPKTFDIIVKKIKELSNGHFSEDNHKKLAGIATDVSIYEAKMTRDRRLVYHIDLVPYGDDTERQAIKVLDICTHAQMDSRLWRSISSQLGRKSKVERDQCAVRNRSETPGDCVVRPAVFPCLPESELPSVRHVPDLPHDDNQALSRHVMEKFVTLSQPLLNCMMADLDVTFPHLVSSKEKEIIEHPGSCYVLGRSGTGKTTTMLFKMLLVERTYLLAADQIPRPRQIFVTKSRVLAKKVQDYLSKLSESLAVASWSMDELYKHAETRTSAQDDEELIDADDIVDWRKDLPRRFSELRDEHFPVITTVDSLWTMLEEDMLSAIPKSAGAAVKDFDQLDKPNPRGKSRQLITYEVFLRDYWRHFSEPLTKALDPSLVYSELMGVIMGSEETLTGKTRFLDSTSYENLSRRNQSTFADQRGDLYNIFEMYRKEKSRRREFDAADRTHRIIKFLREHGVPGQKVHRLYVDEVQDNLLVDTFVLRSLCCDGDGLFWAGDTAQTISVGSSFRFNDLKAFHHRIENKQSAKKLKTIGDNLTKEPTMFQLAVNYRSHAGIVDCAHSIIDLIMQFWGESIDRLAPERGVIDGPKPVFFSGLDEGTFEVDQFLFGDMESHIEFGAQQCILVRDDAARDRLVKRVGDVGLIMTIYESKGLEFNDVLLYDFFHDSPVKLTQWRVVLNALSEVERNGVAVPEVNSLRHTSVCSELKFLYVAITRARENVWLADCSRKGGPMRTFWTAKDLVQNVSAGNDIPRLAASSTKEEWAEKGRELFQHKLYSRAKICYERASMTDNVVIADAYLLREEAQKLADTKQNRPRRRYAYSIAAEAFLRCAQFPRKEQANWYSVSGHCFKESGDRLRAAEAYYKAAEYTECACLYRDLGRYDDAISVVKSFKEMMEPEAVENIIHRARLFYFVEQKIEQANELFESPEEELEYLEEREHLDVAHVVVLESLGRYLDAAELHLAEGRRLQAIELFLKDGTNSSIRKAAGCIIQCLWHALPFGVPQSHSKQNISSEVIRLLTLAGQLRRGLLDDSVRDEIHMFEVIVSGSLIGLRDLGIAFLRHNNLAAAIMSFDHYFGLLPDLQAMDANILRTELNAFHLYVQLLYDVAFDNAPGNNLHILKLCEVQPLAENEFFIPERTILHTEISTEFEMDSPDVSAAGITGTAVELSSAIRRSFTRRLSQRIKAENAMALRARGLFPCLLFSVFGFCRRPDCPEAHLSEGMDATAYNLRIGLHLQQILIFQTLYASSSGDNTHDLNLQRRFWINRLHDALSPPHHALGTTSILDIDQIPEARKGFRVVRDWVRGLVYDLDYHPQIPFLTELIRAATLGIYLDRKEAGDYLYRGRYMDSRIPHYIREGRNYVVSELLNSLRGSGRRCFTVGILFIRHVVERRLHINLGVLCQFFDYLCAGLITSSRYRRFGNVHDVTLPRSWFLVHMPDLCPEVVQDTSFTWLLVKPIRIILEQVYSGIGAEYLLLGGNRDFAMANIPGPLRSIFVAHICVTLSLLGYNMNDVGLRNNIMATFKSLRREGRRFYPLYDDYINANVWDHIARTVRHALDNAPLDEMIQMMHVSKAAANRRPLPGVRQVVYTNITDIPGLLRGHTFDVGASTMIMEDMPPQPPPIDVDSNHDDLVDEDTHIPDEASQELGVEDLDTEDSGIAAPSEEEHHAASVIQSAYRKAISRRQRHLESTLGDALGRSWVACMKEATNIEPGLYRLLFLGPLPHILICVDILRSKVLTYKTKMRKQLAKKKHEELDEVDKKLTQTARVLKKIIRLQKDLIPTANVHRVCDVARLQQLVRETLEMIREEMPIPLPLELIPHVDMGYKGILAEKALPKKQPRPQLNLGEDVCDLYY